MSAAAGQTCPELAEGDLDFTQRVIIVRDGKGEQDRLATLILNDIVPALTIDEDDAWSEQDLHDLNVFALQHALSATDEGSISG